MKTEYAVRLTSMKYAIALYASVQSLHYVPLYTMDNL